MEGGSGGRYGRDRSYDLRQEGSDLSTLTASTIGGGELSSAEIPGYTSPVASFGRRPRYQRLGSESFIREHEHEDGGGDGDEADLGSPPQQTLGLGIAHVDRERSMSPEVVGARRVSIQKVSNTSIRQKYASPSGRTDSAPGSSNPLVSPPIGMGVGMGGTSHLSSTQTAYDPAGTPYSAQEEDEISRAKRKSNASIPSATYPYVYDDTERLHRPKSFAPSVRSAYEGGDFHPQACPTAKSFFLGRSNWLAISIVLIAIFSTVFSGIFMGIAIKAPRWGKGIRTGGSFSPSSADILTQVFAKLIELSFVTVFVTFLGQVLSRRAFNASARGVTIAEITMRNWVMQPGSMITHYETVQYAALTFLGMLSLSVAVFAMLYSTAASALVAPQLKFGGWENKMMRASVVASFANVVHLQKTCKTPIQVSSWDDNYNQNLVGNTCLEIEHAAQGFHNYKQYMSYWDDLVNSGNSASLEQRYRPPGFALHNENVTVNASWIETIDTAAVSRKFNRTINNVTLAMPHSGLVAAGYDPVNEIMQPTDLDGQGVYNIRASVPSPYINVVCANFQGEEYKNFVYANMSGVTLNTTDDFSEASTKWYAQKVNWTEFRSIPIGESPLDEVFGWEEPQDRPIFYKFPLDFNTLLNATWPKWGQDSVYLLGKGDHTKATDYFMCKIKAGLTPKCSTRYEATSNGGSLAAHCEDEHDSLQFLHRNTSRITTTSLDWYNVATEAFRSLSLNTGVTDGAAANARLLTQLMLLEQNLNPNLPSPAEALSVLIGCTLLMSAQDSPVVDFWNYTVPALENPQYQLFNASLRAQQYASGGQPGYQQGFHVVLFAVFALNLFMLIYFIVNKGLVTDFSEPPNLFSLAVNSPPSRLLAGSCGAGPVGEQFKVNWGIETEGRHLFMTDRKGGAVGVGTGYQSVEAQAHVHAHHSHPHVHGTPEEQELQGMSGGGGGGVGGVQRNATFEMDSPVQIGPVGGLERKRSKFGRHLSMLNKRKSFL